MNKFLTKLKKLFYKHYYKERFNRLFDIANNRTITINIEKIKKLFFLTMEKHQDFDQDQFCLKKNLQLNG